MKIVGVKLADGGQSLLVVRFIYIQAVLFEFQNSKKKSIERTSVVL